MELLRQKHAKEMESALDEQETRLRAEYEEKLRQQAEEEREERQNMGEEWRALLEDKNKEIESLHGRVSSEVQAYQEANTDLRDKLNRLIAKSALDHHEGIENTLYAHHFSYREKRIKDLLEFAVYCHVRKIPQRCVDDLIQSDSRTECTVESGLVELGTEAVSSYFSAIRSLPCLEVIHGLKTLELYTLYKNKYIDQKVLGDLFSLCDKEILSVVDFPLLTDGDRSLVEFLALAVEKMNHLAMIDGLEPVMWYDALKDGLVKREVYLAVLDKNSTNIVDLGDSSTAALFTSNHYKDFIVDLLLRLPFLREIRGINLHELYTFYKAGHLTEEQLEQVVLKDKRTVFLYTFALCGALSSGELIDFHTHIVRKLPNLSFVNLVNMFLCYKKKQITLETLQSLMAGFPGDSLTITQEEVVSLNKEGLSPMEYLSTLLHGLPNVQRVVADGCTGLRDIGWCCDANQLTAVSLRECPLVTDFTPLLSLPHLNRVWVTGQDQNRSFDSVKTKLKKKGVMVFD
ncbi:hypothetical protein AGDE_14249 [Angomonas deanei]|nr:hypothetical protein AGDE_14249 [Angomonas deanei]|eukprot:EPY21172.1 hypothetical protein AGDE_14249 [Angomonas deanei]